MRADRLLVWLRKRSPAFLLGSSAVVAAALMGLGIGAVELWGADSDILIGLGLGTTVGALVFSVAVFGWSLGEGLLARENIHRLFGVLDEIAGTDYVKKELTDEERKAVAHARGEKAASLDVRSAYARSGKGKHERLVVLGDGDIWYVTHAGGPGSQGRPPTAKRR